MLNFGCVEKLLYNNIKISLSAWDDLCYPQVCLVAALRRQGIHTKGTRFRDRHSIPQRDGPGMFSWEAVLKMELLTPLKTNMEGTEMMGWKRELPLNMAIVGIYVRFLRCNLGTHHKTS